MFHLIIHDHITKRVPVGLTFAICPVCRDLSAFTATQLRRVGRLYFIPTGQGEFIGNELQCSKCDALLFDRSFALDVCSKHHAEAMIAEIEKSPSIIQRRDLESRARRGHLSAELRQPLLIEPFLLLNYMSATKATPALNRTAGIASLWALTLIAAFASSATNQLHVLTLSALAVSFLIFAWLIARLFTSTHRAAHRNILPLIAQSLRPLRPTRPELESALAAAAKQGSSLAKSLTAAQVALAIHTPDPTIPTRA